MSRSRIVLSHWHKVYENFATSSLDFYDMVEQEIQRWKIPEAEFSRVEWNQSGVLSDRRTYLRVTRGPISFDICAAPYGTGYFFSWWVTTAPKRLLAWAYLLGVLFLTILMQGLALNLADDEDMGFIVGSVLALGALVFLALAVRFGLFGDEEAVIAMPLLGRLYTLILRPITYFEIDTTYMFQAAVGHAVFEVIETVTTAKGIRELSEAERRPVTFDRGRSARALRRSA